jgi:hypothetical protein
MITCHVSIECEGSAFHDDNDQWDPSPELASILRAAAASFQVRGVEPFGEPTPLVDRNGRPVGSIYFTG